VKASSPAQANLLSFQNRPRNERLNRLYLHQEIFLPNVSRCESAQHQPATFHCRPPLPAMGPLVAHLLAALSQPPTLSTVIHVTFKAAVLYIRHWNLFCISLDMELSEEVKIGLKLLSASQPSSVAAFFEQIALRVMDQCPVDAVEAAFSS
jgi:hypothetical protein